MSVDRLSAEVDEVNGDVLTAHLTTILELARIRLEPMVLEREREVLKGGVNEVFSAPLTSLAP